MAEEATGASGSGRQDASLLRQAKRMPGTATGRLGGFRCCHLSEGFPGGITVKWNEMSVFQKIIYVVGFLCSIAAIVLCVLAMTDRLENGLSYALLLLASHSLCNCVQNWKKQKGLAIFSLAVAAFIFISQIYVLIIL